MICSFCLQAISKFESMVNQIQKNAKDINQRLRMIELMDLFKSPEPKQTQDLPSCKVGGHYGRWSIIWKPIKIIFESFYISLFIISMFLIVLL